MDFPICNSLSLCYPIVPKTLEKTRIEELEKEISSLAKAKAYSEAIPYTEELITILKNRLNPYFLDTEITKNLVTRLRHLGSFLMLSGKYGPALIQAQKTLDVCNQLLITDIEQKVLCLNELGNFILKLRKYEEALVPLNTALQILKGRDTSHKELRARVHDLLAAALEGLNRYDEAYSNLEESFKIKSEIFGSTDRRTAQHLEKMAKVTLLIEASPSDEG